MTHLHKLSALSVLIVVACGASGDAPIEQDQCRFPLSDYCEGAECPSWDEAFVDAEEEGRQNEDWCWVVAGECGNLRYIMTRVGLGGVVQFFDDSGALVAREVFSDAPGFCDNTSFNEWYGAAPDCERQPTHNFCKGFGVTYCSAVAECGAINEAECLARYDDPACWARWDSYVYCFSRNGACESCAERLPEWQECAEPSRR